MTMASIEKSGEGFSLVHCIVYMVFSGSLLYLSSVLWSSATEQISESARYQNEIELIRVFYDISWIEMVWRRDRTSAVL